MIVTQAPKKRNHEIAAATSWFLSTVIVNATAYIAFNFSINPVILIECDFVRMKCKKLVTIKNVEHRTFTAEIIGSKVSIWTFVLSLELVRG